VVTPVSVSESYPWLEGWYGIVPITEERYNPGDELHKRRPACWRGPWWDAARIGRRRLRDGAMSDTAEGDTINCGVDSSAR
jgi:hypothetical protein